MDFHCINCGNGGVLHYKEIYFVGSCVLIWSHPIFQMCETGFLRHKCKSKNQTNKLKHTNQMMFEWQRHIKGYNQQQTTFCLKLKRAKTTHHHMKQKEWMFSG